MNWRNILRQNPPPFTGARWIFWVLAGAPSLIAALLPCTDYNETLQLSWIAFAALASAWEAHIRQLAPIAPSTTSSSSLAFLVTRAPTTFLKILFAAFLILIPAVLVLPHHTCNTKRAKIMEMLLVSSSLRTEITQRLHAEKTVEKSGVGLKVRIGGRVAGGLVTEAGQIILVSEEPPAVVMLTPKIIDAKTGESQWVCSGFPEKIMPASCRGEASP